MILYWSRIIKKKSLCLEIKFFYLVILKFALKLKKKSIITNLYKGKNQILTFLLEFLLEHPNYRDKKIYRLNRL